MHFVFWYVWLFVCWTIIKWQPFNYKREASGHFSLCFPGTETDCSTGTNHLSQFTFHGTEILGWRTPARTTAKVSHSKTDYLRTTGLPRTFCLRVLELNIHKSDVLKSKRRVSNLQYMSTSFWTACFIRTSGGGGLRGRFGRVWVVLQTHYACIEACLKLNFDGRGEQRISY